VVQLLVVMAAGAAVYANALRVPFYYDDALIIVNNPLIRDLASTLGRLLRPRGLVDASFAFNYALGALNVSGYHAVNILIHSTNAALLFILLRRLMTRKDSLWPFLGALLFAVHPVQTQSVTYLAQRYTSLSATFFLLAVLLFEAARSRYDHADRFLEPNHLCRYAASAAMGFLALLCKENTATLPVVLLTITLLIVPRRGRSPLFTWSYPLAPYVVAPAYLAYMIVVQGAVIGGASLAKLGGSSNLFVQATSPLHYFSTQMQVIWLYIRMIFAPYGQRLVYDFDPVGAVINPLSVAGLTGILLLLFLAWRVRTSLPLVSLGIIWFFATLSVESSFIPLDPVFEHRLYLPLIGVTIIGAGLVERYGLSRTAAATLLTLAGVLAMLTWQRNALWADPVAFYQDQIAKTPKKIWVYNKLSEELVARRRFDEAITINRQVLAINPYYYKAFNQLGVIFCQQKRYDEADQSFADAVRLNPYDPDVNINAGFCQANRKNWDRAVAYYSTALIREPDNPKILYLSAMARYNMGMRSEALTLLEKAAMLTVMQDPTVLYDLAVVATELRHEKRAQEAREALLKLRFARMADLERAMQQARQRH